MSDYFYFEECPKCKFSPKEDFFLIADVGGKTKCPKCKTKFVVDVDLKEIKPKKK